MSGLFMYLAAINSIAFLANGADKWFAVNNKWRIPERILLGLAFVGGTLGAICGMVLFRHKISKKTYLLLFFGIVVVQLTAVYYYFNR